jgi:succinylglutamate desuccinylase
MNEIKHVLIVGGTHGNELTGIYLIKKFQRFPDLMARSSFNSSTLLANPEAHKHMRRYVDEDLNRCFRQQDLINPQRSSYEAQRAKQINQQFGTKGSDPADVIIDVHSTTSNMGLTLILADRHPWSVSLAAYLTTIYPTLKVLDSGLAQTSKQDAPYLDSISKFGCTVEIGAVPQGVLDATLFQQAEALTHTILDYIEAYNRRVSLSLPDQVTVYQTTKRIDYPRDESGEIMAMVHPQLQLCDYAPLHFGNPLFITFDNQTILYEDNLTVYPVFINEAAYYEKGTAMAFTQPVQLSVTAWSDHDEH